MRIEKVTCLGVLGGRVGDARTFLPGGGLPRDGGERGFSCYLPPYHLRDDRNERGEYGAWQGLPPRIFSRGSHLLFIFMIEIKNVSDIVILF